MGIGRFGFLILVCYVFCSASVSLEFDPADNYLIDCGSLRNTSVGDRVFVSDTLNPSILSTCQQIIVDASANSSSISSTFASNLYQTARVLIGTSSYTFSIRKQGRHWIRLYFFPFVYQTYNLSKAEFSVSAQNFHLLRSSQLGSDPVVKDYCLNITSDRLVISFSPSANSFAYLNAIEVVSVPDELIPHSVRSVDPPGDSQNLLDHALETVFRVNMGNRTVYPQNDTLSRLWIADGSFLKPNSLVMFVSKDAVNYTSGGPTPDIAPSSVYGTASVLNSKGDPNTNANLTWFFSVDPGFEYLVRFHFCDINSSIPGQLLFNVYVNSWSVATNLDLGNQTSDILAAPYYIDVGVTRVGNNNMLSVSVGPSALDTFYPSAILNGLEVMKISSSGGRLDSSGSDIESSRPASNKKILIIVASVTASCTFVFFLLSSLIFLGRRRRKKLVRIATNGCIAHDTGRRLPTLKDVYFFPLASIQVATGNFNENLVIGVGGFGKVYKGVLTDGTTVAVKRGNSYSAQSVAEFKTEIEMLWQFRHRHLVSFIGYCDDQNEMIIVYEYMENGALKNHLYGSDLPSLSWRQRLVICIGSARGLHYLHTGSATPIIHRDVKSANILLDKDYKAKVADFGLSKVRPDLDKSHVSTAVKGSFGYLDPEYLTRQQLTEKSDVYSFGVVMLEVVCGRPVFDPSLPKETMNLVEWAMKWQKKGELEKIIDPSLVGQVRPESFRMFARTAEKCLGEQGIQRPTMGEVLWNLEHAFQLQADEDSPHMNRGVSPELQAYDSTGGFSIGSAGDLVDVSMSQVFSQMMKAGMQEQC